MDALTLALAIAVVVVALTLSLRRAVLYRRRADRVIARWVAEVREGEATASRRLPLPRVADPDW